MKEAVSTFLMVPFDRRVYCNYIVFLESPISVPKYIVPSDPQKLFMYTNASLVLLIQLGFVAFNNLTM